MEVNTLTIDPVIQIVLGHDIKQHSLMKVIYWLPKSSILMHNNEINILPNTKHVFLHSIGPTGPIQSYSCHVRPSVCLDVWMFALGGSFFRPWMWPRVRL